MAEQIKMPKLGASMESGTIVMWLKEEGETVEQGEPLVEILTDKIEIEVESTASGVLLKKMFAEDTEVPVHEVIAYIGEAGEAIPDTAVETVQTPVAEETDPDSVQESMPVTDVSVPEAKEHKIRITPVARKMAKEHGLDITSIKGSGPRGRIHLVDIERALQSQPTKSTVAPQSMQESSQAPEQVKMKGMRKIVAERMAESATTAPHVTLTSEVDMTRAIELRTQLLPKVERVTGFRLSHTETILKVVASTLKKHPLVNATLEGDTISMHHDVHIGLAVAVPNGLMVPVVKHADKKGLSELTTACKTLATKARNGELSTDDLTGGTFTVSNLGMYAVDSFTPIINLPQAAILGVGRIQEKPVGVDGSIQLRPMMTLSLSFDHRVIDGAPAAEFLTDLKTALENPFELLL